MEWIQNIFQWIIFAYGCTLLFIYALLAWLSLRGVRRFKAESEFVDYDRAFQSSISPGISVIAPAFNEALTIIMNVRSLLTLNYPTFEVIIVNDGSTDDTLQQLIDEFEMVEVPFAYDEKIVTRPTKRFYKSTNSAYSRLLVIDKVNGKSKADASNAGVNAAAYDYFLCTDVDCILEKDTLLKMIKPFLDEGGKTVKEVGEPCPECGYVHVVEDNVRVIASGATLRLVNSCEVEGGLITRVRPPKQWLPRFQEMEYIRAYVLGKMGWSQINCVPNVSGGLGLFDKEIAIKAGGYDHKSFAEDMDIVTRMCTYMIENKMKYAIRYIPSSQCWTEGPSSLDVFGRQRTRWGRGLAEIMTMHKNVLFNPRYGRLGLVVLPYNLLFEFLAPILEVIGIISYVYLIVTGSINWPFALILLSFVYLYAVMISTLALLWDQLTFRYYKTWGELMGLSLMAFIEPIVYHPLIVFYALKGYFNFATGRKHTWGNMKRQGFGQKKTAK
ncbi:glycosyltransferase [Sphingobacterium corticis]|uniref:Glycosyltransferase n=1 Tax=Sphingobacterium corticis TaxID=1812823 RepID=A0ABW5NIN5_9SPHI